MGNKMRWRYSDTNPVIAAVDPETVIEIGDLLWLDRDDAKPASMICLESDQAILYQDRSSKIFNFASKFLGVAMQRSPAGEIDPIRVATTGVFEFDCEPTIFELGDLVGAAQDPAYLLYNQQVGKLPDVSWLPWAVGRAAKREPILSTTVLVQIESTVMWGGIFAIDRTVP